MPMTRKCFAAIMAAKDNSRKIKKLTDEFQKDPSKGYELLMEIAKINDKYVADFGNVDPGWQAPSEQN